MNKKEELKIAVLSNIKEEIIDKQSEKRHKLMTKKRAPRWVMPSSVAAVILVAIMVPILILLFAKQVPVYEGMTVSNYKPSSSAENVVPEMEIHRFSYLSSTNGNNSNGNGNNGNHYGQNKKPVDEIIEEDTSIGIEIPEQPMYYAKAGQEIYITVHISNPDSFEILSFTLNGKKYSSYMFEEGSDMENLILKVTVPTDAEGVIDYTIDAIKYVDGTDIKDVDMRGERTVKVGVSTSKQPEATVSDELIRINDVSFDVTLSDRLGLIERCGGMAFAVIVDGDSILSYEEITVGDEHITFEGLETYTSYRYGVVAYYDALDGNGMDIKILFEKEFTTKSVVAPDNIVKTQTSIEFGLIFNELYEEKNVTSMSLYHGEDKVKDFDLSGDALTKTFSATELLSNNAYTVVISYTNAGATETVEFKVTNEAKATPDFEITETEKTQTSFKFDIAITDVDAVGAITKIELVHGEDVTNVEDLTARELTDLLSNNDYTLKATYTYDLNDGVGDQTLVKEFAVKTEAKVEPTFTLKDVTSTIYEISGSYDQTNVDNTLINYTVKLVKGDELVKENTDKEIAFDSLDYYTDYTVKITYTFDVNDGKGVQTKTVEQKIKTAPYVEVKGLSVKNTTTVSTNEYIYLVATLENPAGATVKTATVNGVEYAANGASNGSVLLIDIKNEGQFSNGEVSLSVEKLCVTMDGNDYTIDVSTVFSDTVTVYSRLTILNAEIVNKDLETFDWVSMTVNNDEAKRFVLITLDGAKSNDIKTISVHCSVGGGYFSVEAGGGDLSIDFSGAELIDDTHVLVPLQDMRYYDDVGVSKFSVRINCESPYGGSYEATWNMPDDICVVYDIVYISSAEELLSQSYWECYMELTCDLDFSGISDFQGIYFEGVFNGNGYSIKNVTFMGDYSGENVGIFKRFNGYLRNLNVENLFMYVLGGEHVAGLVATTGNAMNYNVFIEIENCTIDESSVISISNTVTSAIFCAYYYDGRPKLVNCVNYANANLCDVITYGAPGFLCSGPNIPVFIECYNYGVVTSNGKVIYDPNKQETETE